MPVTDSVNVRNLSDKYRNKRKELSAAERSIYSYVYGSGAFAQDAQEKDANGAFVDVERAARGQTILDDISDLTYGTYGDTEFLNDEGYTDNPGALAIERDAIKDRNIFFRIFSRKIDFSFRGGRFLDIGSLAGGMDRKIMGDIAELSPGVTLDAKSIMLKGTDLGNKFKNFRIDMMPGASSPYLTMFLGTERIITKHKIDDLTIEHINGNDAISLETEAGTIVNNNNNKLKKEFIFSSAKFDVGAGGDISATSVKFENAIIKYSKPEEGADNPAGDKTVVLDGAQIIPGEGLVMEKADYPVNNDAAVYTDIMTSVQPAPVAEPEDVAEAAPVEMPAGPMPAAPAGSAPEVAPVAPAVAAPAQAVPAPAQAAQAVPAPAQAAQAVLAPQAAQVQPPHAGLSGRSAGQSVLTNDAALGAVGLTAMGQKGVASYFRLKKERAKNTSLGKSNTTGSESYDDFLLAQRFKNELLDDEDEINVLELIPGMNPKAKADMVAWMQNKDGKVKPKYKNRTAYIFGHMTDEAIAEERKKNLEGLAKKKAYIKELKAKRERGEKLTKREVYELRQTDVWRGQLIKSGKKAGTALLSKSLGDSAGLVAGSIIDESISLADKERNLSFIDSQLEIFANKTFLEKLSGGPFKQGDPLLPVIKQYLDDTIHNRNMGSDDDGKPVKWPYQNSDEHKNAILDVKVPIVGMPLFYAGISVVPTFGFELNASVNFKQGGSKSLEQARSEYIDAMSRQIIPPKKPGDKPKIEERTAEKIFADVYKGVGFGITAAVSPTLDAGIEVEGYIEAGASYLLAARGSLFAGITGKAYGTAGFEAMLSLGAGDLNWKLDADTKLKFGIGLSLKGEAGVRGSVYSRLLGWNKNLFEYKFLEFAIKNLGFNFETHIGSNAQNPMDFAAGFTGGFELERWKTAITEAASGGNVLLTKEELPSGGDQLLKEAASSSAGIEELRTKLAPLLGMLNNVGVNGSFIAESGSESFEELKEAFINFSSKLSDTYTEVTEDIDSIDALVEGLRRKKNYAKSVSKLIEKKQKHTALIALMESADLTGKTTDEILEFYEDHRSLGTGKYDFEHAATGKLRRSAMNAIGLMPDASEGGKPKYLVALEKSRKAEISRKSDLIDKIKGYSGSNADFKEKYYSEEWAGEKSKIGEHMLFAIKDKQKLIDFEKARQVEKSKEFTDKAAEIREFCGKHHIDMNIPNEEFSNWYYTKKSWFAWQTVDYLSPKYFIAYLESKIRNKTRDGVNLLDRITHLEQYKKRYDEARAPQTQDALGAAEQIKQEAREYFLEVPERKKQLEKMFYKTGTAQDILDYENGWQASEHGMYLSEQQAKRKELLDMMKAPLATGQTTDDKRAAIVAKAKELGLADNEGIKYSSIGFWKQRSELGIVGGIRTAAAYVTDTLKYVVPGSKTRWDERKKLVRESIAFESIMDYERERIQKYTDEGKDDDVIRHRGVLAILKQRLRSAGKIADEKKKKQAFEELKKQYFDGELDVLASGRKSEHNDLVSSILDGKLEMSVLQAFLEKDQISYMMEHGKRASQMQEGISKHKLTDAEAFYYYKDVRKGSAWQKLRYTFGRHGGFEDYMKQKELQKGGTNLWENLDIDQMLRFEKRLLNDETHDEKAGYVGTAFVDRVVPGLSVDDDKVDKSWALFEGGYFGLYEKMKAWDVELADKSVVERRTEFAKRVRDNMLSGAFAKQGFFADFFDQIPPQAALEYEDARAYEVTIQERERLKMMERFHDPLTEEDKRAYRDMSWGSTAINDQSVSGKLSHAGKTVKRIFSTDKGYQTGFDKEMEKLFEAGSIELTPEMALAYQEHRLLQVDDDYAKMQFAIDTAASDADKLKAFLDNGGEKMMEKVYKEELDEFAQVDANRDAAFGRDAIIAYERQRDDKYQKLLDKLMSPETKMLAQKDKLIADKLWIENNRDMIEKLNPEKVFTQNGLPAASPISALAGAPVDTIIATQEQLEDYKRILRSL